MNGRCKFAINSPFEYKIPTLSSVKILNKNNVLQTYYTKVIKLGLMTLMVTSLVTPKLVINCKILQTALHKCSIKFLEESFQDFFFFINCKLWEIFIIILCNCKIFIIICSANSAIFAYIQGGGIMTWTSMIREF